MAELRVAQFVCALVLAMATPGCYLSQLAVGQLELVNRQRPIERVVREHSDPRVRVMLSQVPRVKSFARHRMGMSPSPSYRGYIEVDREGLTTVLLASRAERFEAYTRWYPIAGRVPYRAYFDPEMARREEARLRELGYDVFSGPSPAYSTLGWFRDPVTSPMLRSGLTGLIETILHELTHGHLYVPGQTDFNEQLASFVARVGLEQYLRAHGLWTQGIGLRMEARETRRGQFARLVKEAIAELQVLYARNLPRAEVLRRRTPLLAQLSERAAALYPETDPERWQFNNARLLQYMRYDPSTETLEQIWKASGQDWSSFWKLVRRHVREELSS